MIRSLDDAETWYRAVKRSANIMKRLAAKWDATELGTILSRDNRFRDVTSADLADQAKTILDDLDDLAVLVLFSVFEATVRARSEADVDRVMTTMQQNPAMQHPAVSSALTDLKETIKNGSFGEVTAAYKAMDADLTEEVSQVRKFRNWVAHGRREAPENNVDPDRAIDRLRRYLARLEEIETAATSSEPPEMTPGPAIPPEA